ncbi:DegT/DnrJ/EryC1/StrS family aminotransferase [Phaeovulum sp. W22_SRMD_FR3]|uniref:DegT/DnrJ/EryC1/StrS family aminotransferase n=1 Tax=Phaeovulum sp. W22_SRMD_FR3 TaxID=3240274 RepID=UPI003F958AE1
MQEYKFLDVGFTYTSLAAEMDAAYARVMQSGMYIGGAALEAFEAEFAAYCGAKYCVGVGNGLEALVLPLRARGIGPGDEVIVPANTFIATWLAVSQTGAQPVPVDADPATMNIDLAGVAAAITPRTRAIMPVHLYGAPVPCEGLRALAEAHDLLLIEDSAQAVGATDGGKKAGVLGHCAGFSFYPGKNLGAFGDGGAVVTDDAELASAVRMLSNYGSKVKYQHEVAGGNSRLDPLQAAFLSVKLPHLDAWTAQRREIAAVYDRVLADIPGLTLPQVSPGTQSAWHLYVLRHEQRDALQKALIARGVACALHYPVPNHQSGAFVAEFGHMSFPVTEAICRTCLSIPMGPHLSLTDAEAIAAIVAEVARSL